MSHYNNFAFTTDDVFAVQRWVATFSEYAGPREEGWKEWLTEATIVEMEGEFDADLERLTANEVVTAFFANE